MDRRRVTVKRTIAAIVGFAISAAGLYFGLRGLTWSAFEQQLHSIDWRWILVAGVFDALTYVAQGFRWGALLERDASWSTSSKATRAVFVGLLLNGILPFRPGEAVRVWVAARKLNRGVWSVVPSVVVERLIDGFWLAVALVAAAAFFPLPSNLVRGAGWLAVGVAAALVASWFAARRWIASHHLNWNRRAWLLSGAILAAQGVAFWAAIRANNMDFTFGAGCIVMLIVRLGTLVPAAPANLGTHQFATVWALIFFGVPQSAAAAASLVIFAALTIPLVLLGALACIGEGLSFGAIREIDLAVAEPAVQSGS